ncbi:MAG: hypothetical protein J7L95_00975, partial [Prolixibacteraceae bacterium]|nr:hypothetical protein [Prolixibacteraceae bacterium]
NNSEKLKKHEELANSQKLKKFLSLRNTPEKSKEQQKEFKELKRDLGLKSYFKFEKSKKLRLFRETEGSHDLKKYYELKSYLESEEYKSRVAFLKDKKKFEKTEAFKKYQEFKKLAADTDVKFVLKYEKSSIFKNYLDVKESFDLKRYLELKTITTSKEFLERKAYLEDKKKWEKTEDFAKQQAYLEQKKLPHLVNYFKYKGTTAFDFFNQWEVVFEDDFSAATLDSKNWTTQSYWAEKLLGENYSMPGDLHAFTNGENVKTNGKLTLEVRKEKKKGKIWKMPAGFIPVEFDFTSALISTGNSFWMEDGILEAKIYFNPVKEVVSSFYLSGEKNMPRVNLLEMGTKNRLGISTVNKAGKMQVNGLDISNLKKGTSYIFSIQKKGTSFTWKINETEVLRIENSEVNVPLHLNASSIVVFEVPGSKLPVWFQIDRIKCYRKK